ncbi:MAG: rod shape-determining protein MreC [Ignavibacterium sp.]
MIRFFRNIWFNFKEYIVLVFLLIISLSLISINDTKSVRNLRTFVFGSFASITSIFSDFINISNVKEENNFLHKQNTELMLQVNRLREYGIINEELKNLLAFKDTSKYDLIFSRVLSKSLSITQGTFTIDVGLKKDIKPGMPVVDGNGLIGIVYSSSDEFSIVRTLKNTNLKLTVKDERSRVQGILKWSGNELVITNLPKTSDIKPGDRIIISELSTLINLPLPVGTVTKLINPEKGIFNDVVIKPFSDLVKVENVFVIKTIPSKIINEQELNFYKN